MRWNVTVALIPSFSPTRFIRIVQQRKRLPFCGIFCGRIELHLRVSYSSLRRINMYVFLIRLFLDHRLNIFNYVKIFNV